MEEFDYLPRNAQLLLSKEPACAVCVMGKRNKDAFDGWECMASIYSACQPRFYARHCEVIKIKELR